MYPCFNLSYLIYLIFISIYDVLPRKSVFIYKIKAFCKWCIFNSVQGMESSVFTVDCFVIIRFVPAEDESTLWAERWTTILPTVVILNIIE